MSKLEEKLALYTKSLVEKCNITPDAELLKAVTKSLGPSIYNADAEIIAASDKKEVETLKTNFVTKKLGLSDESEIDAAVSKVFEIIGTSNPRKYRAVVCYLLVTQLGKESLFN